MTPKEMARDIRIYATVRQIERQAKSVAARYCGGSGSKPDPLTSLSHETMARKPHPVLIIPPLGAQ
jgi:hypothetical protein